MPRSVRYARGLLWLQSGIWACGALLYAAWAVTAAIMALTGHADLLRHGAVMFFPVAVVTGGFAAAKFRLARSLAGRRERTSKIAVGVEIAMACLGSLITAGAVDSSGGFPAGLFAYAGFVGGCLSLAAALGLMRHPARRFFTDPGPALGSTPDGDSRTAFSAPVNTLRRNLTLRPA